MRILAEGPGWRVSDIICTAGPEDAPFEETHEWVSISAVVSGSFVYRSTHGRRVMAPGAFLLGNQDACFECSHEHGHGDRCIAFHYDPDLIEDVARGLRNVGGVHFREHRLPPLDQLLPFIHDASRLARDASLATGEAEAVACDLASAVLLTAHDTVEAPVTLKDETRVATAIHRINDSYDEPLTLDALAREVGISKFHFARIFRRIAGVTPYAYVLNRRLTAAAVLLSTTNSSVLDISLSCGFSDLSEFTRRFRARFGAPPASFRKRGTLRSSIQASFLDSDHRSN